MGREHQNTGLGIARMHAVDRLEPADSRHGYIHHDHIRLELREGTHGFLAAFRLAHHRDIRSTLKQQSKPHAYHGMIVHQHDADSVLTHRAVTCNCRSAVSVLPGSPTGIVAVTVSPAPGSDFI